MHRAVQGSSTVMWDSGSVVIAVIAVNAVVSVIAAWVLNWRRYKDV